MRFPSIIMAAYPCKHVSCIVYRVSCIVYRVSCIVYRVSCIVYRVSCTVYRVPLCTVKRVPCTMYRVKCTVEHTPWTVDRTTTVYRARPTGISVTELEIFPFEQAGPDPVMKTLQIRMRFCRRRTRLASFKNDFWMLNELRYKNFQNYRKENHEFIY